jgi:hypothetical protein
MEAGFSSCTTRFDGFYLDARSGGKRKLVTSYWKELLKSAAPALLSQGVGTLLTVEKMLEDLEKLGNDENAIFFYQFVQAKTTY